MVKEWTMANKEGGRPIRFLCQPPKKETNKSNHHFSLLSPFFYQSIHYFEYLLVWKLGHGTKVMRPLMVSVIDTISYEFWWDPSSSTEINQIWINSIEFYSEPRRTENRNKSAYSIGQTSRALIFKNSKSWSQSPWNRFKFRESTIGSWMQQLAKGWCTT